MNMKIPLQTSYTHTTIMLLFFFEHILNGLVTKVKHKFLWVWWPSPPPELLFKVTLQYSYNFIQFCVSNIFGSEPRL